jgi:hypothetical protein
MSYDTVVVNKTNVSTKDKIEFLETEMDVAGIKTELSNVDETSNTLNKGISDTIELTTIAEVAKDKEKQSINTMANIAVENICNRLGYKQSESVSLESIGDLIKKAWEAIKAMFSRLWQGLKAIWNKTPISNNKASEKSEAAEAKIEEIKKENPEGFKVAITEVKAQKVDLTSYCRTFNTTNANHLNENIVKVLNNHLKFLNYLDKYKDINNEVSTKMIPEEFNDWDSLIRLIKTANENSAAGYEPTFIGIRQAPCIFIEQRYLSVNEAKKLYLASVSGFAVMTPQGHYPNENQFKSIKDLIDKVSDKLNKLTEASQSLEIKISINMIKLNKQIQSTSTDEETIRFKLKMLENIRNSLVIYNGHMLGLTATAIAKAAQYLKQASSFIETEAGRV